MTRWLAHHAIPFGVSCGLVWSSYQGCRAARVSPRGATFWWLSAAVLEAVMACSFALLWTGVVDDRAPWSEIMGALFVFALPVIGGVPAMSYANGRSVR